MELNACSVLLNGSHSILFQINLRQLPCCFFFQRSYTKFKISSIISSIVATKLVHFVTLCSNKQATTSFTQFVYTTLTKHTYSLVANNLTQFIMEEIFYEFGVAYLRWTDEKGNIKEAVKEQVDILGKECFEYDPFENEEQNN